MTAPTSPLRGAHDDDLLLDRLGRREAVDADGIGGVLQAWVAAIDADSVSLSAPAPVMRVPDPGEVAEVAVLPSTRRSAAGRLIRLSGSRLAAAATTAALVSGAGVAAALSGHEVPGVSTLLRTVGAPIPEATPTGTPSESTAASGVGRAQIQERSRRVLKPAELRTAQAVINKVGLPALQIPQLMLEMGVIDEAIASPSPTDVPILASASPTGGTGTGTGAGPAPAPTGGASADSSAPTTSNPSPSSSSGSSSSSSEPTSPSPSTSAGSTSPDPKPAPTTGAGSSATATGSGTTSAKPPKGEEASDGPSTPSVQSAAAAPGKSGVPRKSASATSADDSDDDAP